MSPSEHRHGVRYAEPIPAYYIPISEQADGGESIPLKHGDTFAFVSARGEIPKVEKASSFGIYHKDTRHLSGFDLVLEGRRPLFLSSSLQDDNALLTIDFANPDIYRDGELVMSRETLHIVRSKFLGDASFNERVLVQNFGMRPLQIRILLWFDADFVDLFEVRGIKRKKRGELLAPKNTEDGIQFVYRGLDGDERATTVRLSPTPTALAGNHAVYDLSLEPQESRRLWVYADFERSEGARNPTVFGGRLRNVLRSQRRIGSGGGYLSSSSELLNQALCRATADLHMLTDETAYGLYPCAGIPWFSTPFGRDGIITAMQMLWLDPSLARGVLRYLAATQATRDDPDSDAEPGKILHETRQGEMARTGEVPFGRYYGSVDATPLFVVLAGRYWRRTADIETIRAIWPNIEAALRWIDGPGDVDRDGFVEYRARSKKGLGNQGWKDSFDSVMHADGTLAYGRIALCEVQAYVYEAKRLAADLARLLGREEDAARLEREAKVLGQQFEAAFWCEDIGTYALALDGDKNACRVRSSNAGHVLFGGISSEQRAHTAAATLMNAESFSGWGIRTLAMGEARFNPMSYHNGSIWPHDNSVIAMGLARYGLTEPVLSIFNGLFEAARHFEDQRLPELFCGFARRLRHAPTRYPVACSPQAWASGTLLSLLSSLLGIEIDAAAREVRLKRPLLPSVIEELELCALPVGHDRLDFRLFRHGPTVGVDVLDRGTDIKVIVEA